MFQVYAVTDARMALREMPGHAQRAERMGYSGLTVPEALHDGFLMALLALEHTRELRVATSVVLAFPRSPMSVAYVARDLQDLSHGRLELGLGTQVKANMEGRFSVKWKPPIPRMREYISALRAIWDSWQNGSPLRFEGEHYRFTRMQPFFNPGPTNQPSPLIFLGGVGPRMTQLAGEMADGLMTHPTNTSPRYLRELTLPNVEAGAKRAGRSPAELRLMAGGFVATGPTPDAVGAERERIREYLTFLYSTPQYWSSLELYGWAELGRRLHQLAREGRWEEMGGAITDEMLDQLVPSGPYEEIAEILSDWYGGLASSITFPMPDDPKYDPQASAVIRALRSAASR
ncbi:MAG: TIGR03617 family F420-dependent LLM class oxidoreductase [Deltaproteobacteria bacterium]|nr:TIGR03617 family F420-dependent LLM class oxidoreductase [Deltaproteobacteria bacterium]